MKQIRNNYKVVSAKQSIINLAKRTTPDGLRLFLRKINWQRMYLQETLFRENTEFVYCPIAQKEFKLFPKNITITSGSRARHRLFWLFLERETDVLTKKNVVLHCAPEYGTLKRLLNQGNLNYVPADKFMDGYSYQKEVANVDLLNIPYNDNHFDYIICNRVLEHIEGDIKAMSEMYRVLKKGGTALLSVPIDYNLQKTHESYTSLEDRIKYYGQWDHVRMYSGDIKQRLEKIGFDVEMIKYTNNFTQEEIRKFGLVMDTIIVARKKR
jgi:predicted SAM-dependent methyltransferase